ncbi:ABC transporter permease [Candidatus Dependentiae bacterium]
MQSLSYFHVIKELLRTDLMVFRKMLIRKWIDLFIWIVTMVLVFAYVMPAFGLERSYGGFMLASMCSTTGLFQAFSHVAEMVADFEGNRLIDYYVCLPVPSWMIFVRFVLYYVIASTALGILVLPIGKLMLWNSFSFAQVSYVKYLLIFTLSNIFYAILALWSTSFVKSLIQIDTVWMRLIYPMWFLGCFQFSWFALYKTAPVLAYIDLINPITYTSEGMRAAVLGQQGSLNFWVCVLALLIFITLGGVQAVTRFKRQLDFV